MTQRAGGDEPNKRPAVEKKTGFNCRAFSFMSVCH